MFENLPTILLHFIIFMIPMIFAITIHEASHAYVSKYCGDPTAYFMGRMTLNPIRHIDLLGTIILPIIMFFLQTNILFGWAKPVPINFNNFKNIKYRIILVSIAGPLSNFFMALIWFFLLKCSSNFSFNQMAECGLILNLMIMIVNLLPIPPLDGSRIISVFLSYKINLKFQKMEHWGWLIIFLLFFIPFSDDTNLFVSLLLSIINYLIFLMQFIYNIFIQ